MIDPKIFVDSLNNNQIEFITGVPDSLLKDICAYITENYPQNRHIIATNEGSAIGMAIGYHLSTGTIPLVYMQNSGLGNIVNPITSLVHPDVYGIPMLLMIGWRGEFDVNGNQIHDEPQHVKQGMITPKQLELLDIPYEIIDSNTAVENVITKMVDYAKKNSRPVAILVRKATFSKFTLGSLKNDNLLTREEVIETIISILPPNFPVISTTGMASRELYEIRENSKSGHFRDFLTVGGMGHASQIAAGVSLGLNGLSVVCIDGDGSALMHLGALSINATIPNLIHILINNGAHDSVGGQPTLGSVLSFSNLAKNLNFNIVKTASTKQEIKESLNFILQKKETAFLEIKCKTGARSNLGRPETSPKDNKVNFMNFLKKSSNAK
jgi:phosphonopyruvate decarboxylase